MTLKQVLIVVLSSVLSSVLAVSGVLYFFKQDLIGLEIKNLTREADRSSSEPSLALIFKGSEVCLPEVEKHCRDSQWNRENPQGCLRKKLDLVGPDCRKVIEFQKAQFVKFCGKEAEQFCRGEESRARCLKMFHIEKLSPDCREHLFPEPK